MKPHFTQEKRPYYERYRLIPKVVTEYDGNKINEVNIYLTEKCDHVMLLYYSLIIVYLF